MKAEIISVGKEILTGNTLNTNTQFLSRELKNLGIEVCYHSTIDDEEKVVIDATLMALSRSEIIIYTGGLGPTTDDLTKEAVAKAIDVELVLNKSVLSNIKDFFITRDREMPQNNKKQAFIPLDAIPLNNEIGTAPGIFIKKKEKMIFLLPGPPREMINIFNNKVKPLLNGMSNIIIDNKVLKTVSIGESALESKLKMVINKHKNPIIATYVNSGGTDIVISAKAKTKEESKKMIDKCIDEIAPLIKDYIYAYEDQTIEEVVYKMLLDRGKVIGFCESCTGGLISSRFTKISGASSVFDRGIVTYSNQAKIDELGVNFKTIKNFGAVSKETAKEMAEGLLKKNGIDISVSVTGIAGPGGGSREKPVGLVYIGLATKNKTVISKYNFKGNREKIQRDATNTVFDIVRKYLISIK